MRGTMTRDESPTNTARRRGGTNPQLAEIWRRFLADRDVAARNLLMEHYLHIVRYNAERVAAKLPHEVDPDDLVSAGYFGLMDALEAFDPGRGVKFETYCAPRIRGAILDELRGMDWVPRLVRSKAHQVARVRHELEQMFGRSPTEEELAERLDLSRAEMARLLRDSTAVAQVSLSRPYGESDSNKDVSELDVIEDPRGRNPLAEIQRRDIKDMLTRGMSRAERLILILYYYEEMTMKEIGATLDLSESRVSQMHSSIVDRLKSQLDRRARELAQ